MSSPEDNTSRFNVADIHTIREQVEASLVVLRTPEDVLPQLRLHHIKILASYGIIFESDHSEAE